MLAVMSAVVILLRALPFLVFRGERRHLPPMLDYLGKVLTAAEAEPYSSRKAVLGW